MREIFESLKRSLPDFLGCSVRGRTSTTGGMRQVLGEVLVGAAVLLGRGALAELGEEVAQELVVAEVGLLLDRPARVQRPGAGVEGRDLLLGREVAGVEQLAGGRVPGQLREVVEPDQRLDEAVEDEEPRLARVLQVVGAVAGLHAHARGRGGLEDPEPAQRDREDLRLALELGGRARHRLQARALGERGDPRRARCRRTGTGTPTPGRRRARSPAAAPRRAARRRARRSACRRSSSR